MRTTPIGQAVQYFIVILILTLTLYPLLFILFNSIKSPGDYAINMFTPNFGNIDWSNFQEAIPHVLPYVWNSVKVSLLTLAGVLFLSTGTAYVMAFYRFPARSFIYSLFLSTMMIPSILTFVPMFLLVRDLKIINTHLVLILPWISTSLAFAILLLRTFFEAVDRSLIESARIDGAKELNVLFRIVLPLTVPMLATVSVLNILGTWNNFLWPLVTISDIKLRTVPVGLQMLINPYSPINPQLAGYVLSSIPLMVLFLFSMKHFIAGLSSGAIKG